MARHVIPADGWPHQPSAECGCCPDRRITDGRAVYEHPRMAAPDAVHRQYTGTVTRRPG